VRVRQVLLTPKWLIGHAVVVALAVVFCRLGWWQWSRYRITHGDLQNLSYALQWPVFAAFGVAMWVRILRDAVRPAEPQRRASRPRLLPADIGATPGTAAATGPNGPAGPPGPAGPAASDEPDDAHAAYNRYLASLYERDRQEQS
jgi:hypothetical protein